MTTNAKMRKDSERLPLWEPFSFFFALWYIEVCYDILDGHIQYIHFILHMFTFIIILYFFSNFQHVSFSLLFFTLIFWYFLSCFLFSFLSLLVWWLCFDIFLCWYMFKHVQTYTKARDFTRRMVFFSHAQSKQRGCGCLRDYAKCYRSSKFSYVAFCCFIYYIIYTCLIIYIYIT